MKTIGQEFVRMIGNEIRDYQNSQESTYIRWLNDLRDLYISIFDWTGLTSPIDMDMVERYLLDRGSVVFFVDEMMGPLILPYVTNGFYDCYGNPYSVRAYGVNGYQITLEREQFVIIWDNTLKIPNAMDLAMYASRLADCDRIADINLDAQRTPVLLTAENEGQMTSLKTAYRKVKNGDPVIAQIGTTVQNGVTAFRTDAPMVFNEVNEYKNRILNECLTLIGVPNIGNPKAERMITNEISAINGHVVHERNSRLIPRIRAVDEINRKFGYLGIRVGVDYANQDYNIGINDEYVATPEVNG